MPTARNARGVDIIAYSADASRFIGIQVKALSKRNPVPLGPSLDKCMGDFWVIVNNVACAAPSVFVLKPSEVKKGAHRGVKDGRISYWLQPGAYDQPQFKEKWDRIGSRGLDADQAFGPTVPAQQEFFDLAERFRAATDPEEVKRLGDQMGRLVFGR